MPGLLRIAEAQSQPQASSRLRRGARAIQPLLFRHRLPIIENLFYLQQHRRRRPCATVTIRRPLTTNIRRYAPVTTHDSLGCSAMFSGDVRRLDKLEDPISSKAARWLFGEVLKR